MNTKTILGMLMLALILALPVVHAADNTAKPAAQKAEQATGRRKKVEMCKECGKPESECECEEEGEGHGHDHGKGHSDDDGHGHDEEKK